MCLLRYHTSHSFRTNILLRRLHFLLNLGTHVGRKRCHFLLNRLMPLVSGKLSVIGDCGQLVVGFLSFVGHMAVGDLMLLGCIIFLLLNFSFELFVALLELRRQFLGPGLHVRFDLGVSGIVVFVDHRMELIDEGLWLTLKEFRRFSRSCLLGKGNTGNQCEGEQEGYKQFKAEVQKEKDTAATQHKTAHDHMSAKAKEADDKLTKIADDPTLTGDERQEVVKKEMASLPADVRAEIEKKMEKP